MASNGSRSALRELEGSEYNWKRYESPSSPLGGSPMEDDQLLPAQPSPKAPNRSEARYWHRLYEFPKPLNHEEWLEQVKEREKREKEERLLRAKVVLEVTRDRAEKSTDAFQEWRRRKALKSIKARVATEEALLRKVLRARVLSALSVRKKRHREWLRRKEAERKRRAKEVEEERMKVEKRMEAQEKENEKVRKIRFQQWLRRANKQLRDGERKERIAALKLDEARKKLEEEKKRKQVEAVKMQKEMNKRFANFKKEGWVLMNDDKSGRYRFAIPDTNIVIKKDPKVEAAEEEERSKKEEERRTKIKKSKKEEERRTKIKKSYTRWLKKKNQELKEKIKKAERKKESVKENEKLKKLKWKKKKIVLAYSFKEEERDSSPRIKVQPNLVCSYLNNLDIYPKKNKNPGSKTLCALLSL
ncbi:hypothetical protein AAMO2058_000337300 [Amorphochlora amoebiformis]